ARALVGAVFAPHDAEDAEFRVGGLASQKPGDLVVLSGCELMTGDEVRRDGAHPFTADRAPARDWRMTSPSVDPIRASAARSGCGIMPATFRFLLRIPAMSRTEPFGLSM